MNLSSRGHHIRRKTLMIFYVARTFVLRPTLKFVKQLRGVFPEYIDQHIEPATMGHANDNFLCPIRATALHHL